MSSLLQFNGSVGRRGVELQFTLVTILETRRSALDDYDYHITEPRDTFTCDVCGREHQHIYLAYRKPAGVWGHWAVFRYLGEEHVPDLSFPIDVDKVPRGASRCDAIESAKIWHS